MSRKIFITGTDTGVGKTYVSVQLLNQFAQDGLSTLGLKPIASGCQLVDGQLVNDDALALAAASTIKVDYATTNPFAFEPPIAPHIAAQLCKQPLSKKLLAEKMQAALSINADITIIEGAGGWLLPLNEKETLADYVIEQGFEIILVVGMRLGCLNHALLTERAIRAAGGKLTDWVPNCIDPQMNYLAENIKTLELKLAHTNPACRRYLRLRYAKPFSCLAN